MPIPSLSLRWALPWVLACAVLPSACDEAPEEVERERPPLRVRAHRVSEGTARSWVYGQGTVEAVRRELLTFEKDGRVAYVSESSEGRPLQVGDPVRGPNMDVGDSYGQLLMSLDNREQAAAVTASEAELHRTRNEQVVGSADVKSARASLDEAEAEYERVQALVAAAVVPAAELDSAKSRHAVAVAAFDSARARSRSSRSGTTAQEAELERAHIGLEKGSIFAPFDGVIAYLNLEEGDYFFSSALAGQSEEQRLRLSPIVVIDPSEFALTLHLPAYEADGLARGQTALILSGKQIATVSAGERSIFDEELAPVFAEVYAVSPSIDPSSRTIEVKLRTTAGAERLRDGEFVTCWIITEVSEDTILAPFDIMVRSEDGPRAYVVDEGDMSVSARSLSLGIRDMVGMEVREGLAPGDLVVTEGRHAISSGSAVEVVGLDQLHSPREVVQ